MMAVMADLSDWREFFWEPTISAEAVAVLPGLKREARAGVIARPSRDSRS